MTSKEQQQQNEQEQRTYSFEIDIPGGNQDEAIEKLEAFGKLMEVIEHDDLVAMAEYITINPQSVQFIKKMITSTKGNQIIGRLGKMSWIRNPIENITGLKVN